MDLSMVYPTSHPMTAGDRHQLPVSLNTIKPLQKINKRVSLNCVQSLSLEVLAFRTFLLVMQNVNCIFYNILIPAHVLNGVRKMNAGFPFLGSLTTHTWQQTDTNTSA